MGKDVYGGFDNGMVKDIITEYKKLLGYRISSDEVYGKIKGYYEKDFVGKDNEDDYWLSIACFQWENGILNEEVKENAIRCIDDGRFMERWRERGKKAFEKRKTVLGQIRYNLLNVVNPVRKKFPKCKSYLREKSPFKVGDLILYKPLQYFDGALLNPKVEDTSKKMCGKYVMLRVVDIPKIPVSEVMPDLDYCESTVFMAYDWVGDYIPSREEISGMKFKKLLNRVEYVRCNVGNPYYIKKMRTAYKLGSVEYLEIGELCELDVIGNDMDFSLEDVGLWNEYPYSICFDYSLNTTLYNSFTEYGYQEEWG